MLAVVKVVGASLALVAIGVVVYMLGRRRAQAVATIVVACGLCGAASLGAEARSAEAAAVAQTAPSPTPPAPPHTIRVDYFHTGNATEERFSLDRVVLE